MKYLIVIAVVWIAFWFWRQERRARLREREQPPPSPREKARPQEMLRCAHCGVHLPAADALRGADGQPYCCAAHRQAAQP